MQYISFKPFIFTLIILSLFSASIFFFWSNARISHSPFVSSFKMVSASGVVDGIGTIITMDRNGFKPVSVEIKQGESVTFKNVDSRSRWPASNIHPSHGIYSEFDPKGEVLPGRSWSFTFYKVGEWRFHDHLYPELTGFVVVKSVDLQTHKEAKEGVGEKKPSLPKGSFGETGDELKIVNMVLAAKNELKLRELIKNFGPKEVMDDLLNDSGGGAMIDCHQEAHAVGRIAYEIYGPSVFTVGNSLCHSGYYHGAMETFLAEKGTLDIAKNIAYVCDLFDTSFKKFECLHGTGHGILAYEDYNLPKALEVCNLLGSAYMASSCYGGAFMENIVTAQGSGAKTSHKTEWASQDPHFPCNKLSKDHDVQYQCYQMQTSWMLTLREYDFDKVVADCLGAPSDMISVCFKSLGRDAAGHTLRNSQKIKEICEKVPHTEEYYKQCVVGAINVIVDFWGDSVGGRGSELCRILPEEGKRSCYQVLSSRLIDVFGTPIERKSVCSTFEKEYQNLCSSL